MRAYAPAPPPSRPRAPGGEATVMGSDCELAGAMRTPRRRDVAHHLAEHAGLRRRWLLGLHAGNDPGDAPDHEADDHEVEQRTGQVADRKLRPADGWRKALPLHAGL